MFKCYSIKFWAGQPTGIQPMDPLYASKPGRGCPTGGDGHTDARTSASVCRGATQEYCSLVSKETERSQFFDQRILCSWLLMHIEGQLFGNLGNVQIFKGKTPEPDWQPWCDLQLGPKSLWWFYGKAMAVKFSVTSWPHWFYDVLSRWHICQACSRTLGSPDGCRLWWLPLRRPRNWVGNLLGDGELKSLNINWTFEFGAVILSHPFYFFLATFLTGQREATFGAHRCFGLWLLSGVQACIAYHSGCCMLQ